MAAPTGTSSNRRPPTSVFAVYAAGPCALVVARAADVGLGCGYDHLLVEYHHNSRMEQRCLQSVGSGRRSLVISSLLVTLISNLFSRRCQAIQLPDIYWNSSNPIKLYILYVDVRLVGDQVPAVLGRRLTTWQTLVSACQRCVRWKEAG
ncbi:hypothetical protein D917_07657 [Trichinella nativa]|uniref:Uncharacterized protein n=1 Tax=Trichinella nativa TaxID=6335 RepID=A0A1Y3ETY6_9BILA|nr:hypothetical protein D917_07657 [Trichinella nativa]